MHGLRRIEAAHDQALEAGVGVELGIGDARAVGGNARAALRAVFRRQFFYTRVTVDGNEIWGAAFGVAMAAGPLPIPAKDLSGTIASAPVSAFVIMVNSWTTAIPPFLF